MKMPDLKNVSPVLAKTGSVAGGFVAGHVLKEVLMGTSILSRDTPLVPDNIATNAGGVVVGVLGALAIDQLATGKSKEYLVLAAAGTSAYFLIRLMNKATDSLKGLGTDTAEGSIKEWLTKLIPRLEGLGETAPTASQVADFQRMINQYNPAAQAMPVSRQLYGMGNTGMTKALRLNAA